MECVHERAERRLLLLLKKILPNISHQFHILSSIKICKKLSYVACFNQDVRRIQEKRIILSEIFIFINRRNAMTERKMSRRTFISATAMAGLAMALDWGKINALAANIQTKKDLPVVVIGAGLGGLCCGALLARKVFRLQLLNNMISREDMQPHLIGLQGSSPLRCLCTECRQTVNCGIY